MPLLLSSNQYVIATYEVISKQMEKAITAIVRGQTIGNPTVHALKEDVYLAKKHCARAVSKGHLVQVYFPKRNFGNEGVNYLMSVLMGGQCDVDIIQGCRLVELDISCLKGRTFRGPRFGVEGIRRLLNYPSGPLIGGIIKPKIGLSPSAMADICHEMAEGGCHFIKEDEIMGNQNWCPMKQRIPAIAHALKGYKTLYAPCITGDGREIVSKARRAQSWGATALHINIWCSLGAYADVRDAVKIPIFFQKSGDKVWTTGPFSVDFKVICQLANKVGCDFAHVGMYGGYMAEPVAVLKGRIEALGSTIPSFSCGLTPDQVPQIRSLFGDDILLASGGYICGYQNGIKEAVGNLRKASE